MSADTTRPSDDDPDMLPEYDFSHAVRGKHYKPLHEGYTVEIHMEDGSTVVKHFKLEEGTVLLQPDVQKYFPNSEAVNSALRSLIQLMHQLPKMQNRETSMQELVKTAPEETR